MTRPPGQGSGEPWWARPGGVQPGRPAYPPQQPRPPYPPRQQPRPQYPPPQPPRPQYPPPQEPRPYYQPPQEPYPAQSWQPQQYPPPQQYGQSQPSVSPRPKPTPSRTPMIAGMVVAVVVIGGVALVGGLWFTGFFGSGTVLNVRAAEAGVQQILSDPINGYGANDVTKVDCNNGEDPAVEKGAGFTCKVEINGALRQVQVVFRDDAGTYEVDGPR
jgi:hypothetical protein